MNSSSQICATCGQPKTAKTTASFTQWIFSCRCDVAESETPELVSCSICGMPIDENKTGSFTQWVFKSQICTCERPRPLVSGEHGDLQAVLHHASQRPGNKSQLASLNATNFPLDRYKPLDTLGTGGAGAVYLCFDNHLRKNVAVKVLKASQPEPLEAFQTEAKVTAKFKHANVISIIDFGLTKSSAPYMVLEYVDGASLDNIISSDQIISNDAFVRLFVQIASALEKGHEEGIFHRDIKSSNIIVTSDEQGRLDAHVIDFGIAIFDKTGYQGKTLIGTPKYMSPDQFLGKPFDSRSEIYSLGCVMYEVLTGRLPFKSEDVVSLLEKHATEKVVPLSEVASHAIEPELEQIVLKCLEKDPDARFQSMRELVDILNGLSFDQSNDDISESSEIIPLHSIGSFKTEDSEKTSMRLLAAALVLVVVGIITVLVAREALLPTQDVEQKRKDGFKRTTSKESKKRETGLAVDSIPSEALPTPAEVKELEALNRAIALDPKDSQLYYQRTKLFSAMERYDEAAADYKKAIALVPTQALYREELADLYLKMDKREEASKVIEDAIKVGAVGARIYKFKATILADQNRLDEALAAASQSVKLAPTYDTALITRGLINYKLGRFQQAVDDYTASLKVSPNELRALHGRADAYDKLGQHELAMRDRKGGGSGDYGDLINAVQIGSSSMRTLVNKSQEIRRNGNDPILDK